jgi:hypothetical protein
MKGWAVVRGHGRHRRRRPTIGRRLRLLRPGLAAVLLIVACASAVVVGTSGVRTASAAAQPYNGPCPGGGGACVQVQLPCQTSPCPSAVAGPTQGLDSDQYVYLALSDYPVGDTIRIAYCATDGSGTIDADPYCATTTPDGVKLSKQFVEIGSNGSTDAALPVDFDPPGQDNPALAAVPLVQNGDPASSFFCDNGPDFCSVVITDDGPTTGAGPTNTSANTVIVPLNFSAGASACPTTDPELFSDSSFTVERLIPAVVQATCSQKNGVVALDTATNTASEVTDLSTGGTPIAFSDDPWDSQLNNPLTSGSASFAYIPVALSATVVSFLGGAPDEAQSGVVFPLAQYDMTPNMVAGVLTTSYEGGGTVDSLVTAPTGDKPPLTCTQIVGCSAKTMVDFNAFYMLNPEPSGVGQPAAIGSYFSNTASGTNYQLSNWLCSAPNAPFALNVDKKTGPVEEQVTDTYDTASGTLTTPPTQSPFWNPNTSPSEWPFKTCQATSQFPTLSAGNLSQYQPSDTPALQAKSIRAYGSSGNLAFGAMDWSEASFNGLNLAAVQNASGAFVTPSQTSIDAALTTAVEQPNGTYTFNYDDTGNSTAYPMPMVTYAVVPTAGVPAAQAQSVTNFLTNMVTYSSGKDGTLPGGYVPLTPALVTQATQDIAKDVKAAPAGTSGSSGSSGSGSTGSGASGGSGVPPQTQSDTGIIGLESSGDGLVTGTGSTGEETGPGAAAHPSTPATPTPAKTPAAKPAVRKSVIAADFDVVVGGARLVIPVLVALAAAAFIAGPALLAWPRRRRRSAPAGPSGTASEGRRDT